MKRNNNQFKMSAEELQMYIHTMNKGGYMKKEKGKGSYTRKEKHKGNHIYE